MKISLSPGSASWVIVCVSLCPVGCVVLNNGPRFPGFRRVGHELDGVTVVTSLPAIASWLLLPGPLLPGHSPEAVDVVLSVPAVSLVMSLSWLLKCS